MSNNKSNIIPLGMSLETRQALSKEFPADKIRQDVTKPDGFKPRYIAAPDIVRRLDEVFAGGWSFEVKNYQWGDTQVIVHGSLSVQVMNEDNSSLIRIVKEQFGQSDIRRARDGRTPRDPGADIKAAATDALKKCATLFGVALHLYEQDESPMQGLVPVDQQQIQQNAQQMMQPAGPAQPFQIQSVMNFFARIGISQQDWMAGIGVQDPSHISGVLVGQILAGQHPYVQKIMKERNVSAPTGLNANNA